MDYEGQISINDSALSSHVVIRMSHTDLALLDDLMEMAEESVTDAGTVFDSEATREELRDATVRIRFAIKALRDA